MFTSRKASRRVAWWIRCYGWRRPAKAGHAGTLDPLAEGVLVVCVGRATRLIEFVQRQRKCYTGGFLLGRQSDTEDIEGVVETLVNQPQPTRAEIESVAIKLTGEILQRPPAYSALKVKGQRAYDLARAGHDVQLARAPSRFIAWRSSGTSTRS